jgi:predicted alpha/beta-hydrolase family hydrolase
MSELAVAVGEAATTAILYSAPGEAHACYLMAHGAGAGQRSPFLTMFAEAISRRGIDVVTFDFLYRQQGRRLPDRRPALESCYQAVAAAVHERVPSARRALFIGGKSMGGRIATHLAAAEPQLPLAGVVLLGYPLHPPGKPHERRDEHLPEVRRPMLFVQGSRDTFGTPAELEPVLRRLSPPGELHVVDGGDHSFKVARGGTSGQAAVYAAAQQAVAEWITRTA